MTDINVNEIWNKKGWLSRYKIQIVSENAVRIMDERLNFQTIQKENFIKGYEYCGCNKLTTKDLFEITK